MKKKFIIFSIFGLIFMALFIVCFSKDPLLTTKEIVYNGDNLKISVDGQVSNTLPTSGNYYLVRYDCKSKDTKLTWNRDTHQLDISNKNKKGGVSCYLDFETMPKLADMPVGSFVKYTGNNGCNGAACDGENPFKEEGGLGSCMSDIQRYYFDGWRVAYSKGGTAYLISAGATDCLCTNEDGSTSDYDCGSEVSGVNMNLHVDNLNQTSLKYCNTTYAYNGVCDENSAWGMNMTDYKNMLNKTADYCYMRISKLCGTSNSLIHNGGVYWFTTTAYDGTFFSWGLESLYDTSSSLAYGVRPVLRLQSSVIVVGGSGTEEDPYQLANNTFQIHDGTGYVGESLKAAVPLSLLGSNVSQMCINTNSSGCSNYVPFASSYTLDWSSEEDGEKIVYVYYKNSEGNIIASMNRKVILDTVPPKNSSVAIGAGSGLTRVLQLRSEEADTMCFSNTSNLVSECTNWVKFSNSYRYRLSEGTGDKTVYAFFKDKAGNVSTATASTVVESIVEFIAEEDFSDNTYDSNITIADGATYPWIVTNGRFQSNNKGVNASSSISKISFTPTIDSTLSFDYGVSSETNYDKFTVTLAGSDSSSNILVEAISGVQSGSKTGISLSSGVTYTLTLSYAKDGSGASNDDIAYIDNLLISS